MTMRVTSSSALSKFVWLLCAFQIILNDNAVERVDGFLAPVHPIQSQDRLQQTTKTILTTFSSSTTVSRSQWSPQLPRRQIPRTTQGRRISSQLSMAVAKTGGRLIKSADEYKKLVLGKLLPNTDSADEEDGQEDERLPVLVFFTAPWCGPCRLSVPVVKDVMKEFVPNRLQVVEVCTDDLPEVAADSNVVSIPTIQIYSPTGELMDTIVGCVAKSVLFNSVEKALEDIAVAAAAAAAQQQRVGGGGSD